jgi:D-citramalate synthase
MLADTLGIMNPNEVYEYCKRMVTRYPKLQFDFHAHNDYDLATSNMFAAALVGIKGLHCTINGLGERAGNAPLASVVAVVHDMLHMTTDVDEKQIYNVSHIVESFSGILVPQNKPIIGESVFTQTAGIHADGDNKNELYYNDLLPERFGRKREYALGKLSGEASIKKNLIDLGIELSEEDIRKVTKRVVALGDKKEMVTQDDLPYIVSDVTKHDIKQNKVRIVNYALNISEGLKPTATLKLNIDGKEYQQSAVGDGQYDAFVKAIHKIYKDNLKRSLPILTNYTVSIPPHSTTDALVMTNITWNYNNHIIKTRGIDADQIEAAIQATLKMLNIIENF